MNPSADDAIPHDAFPHDPVLLEPILELFASVPAGVVLDATLGGAGHANALLERHPHLAVLGLDRDAIALAAATARLAWAGDRAMVWHTRFDHLDDAMNALHIDQLSGALFDLGVSSPQLDTAERGFSYRLEAPLDMRMDQRDEWTAADIVNGWDESRLASIIRRHGDERFATRIAAAIVAARPIETTTQLSEIVVRAIPAAARRTGGHPAKRTFQALRIELNRELDVLAPALERAIDRTAEGGRVVVLSYHSGEDRIVKSVMRQAETGGCVCPPELPCVCDAVQTVRLVRGVPRTADGAERDRNPRARSARMRVVEKISPWPRRGRSN
jgi:16S rRNA (cytosine1402-N4)-methyltransferase